ncbi:MAG TPA: lipocalin-like domain-containing protein [Steroidobacteraceae bacterium]|jgi:hypothetical protein
MLQFNLKGYGRGTIVASLIAISLASSIATAAQPDSIVGTWVLTAADKLLPNGTRVADYGPSPHGLVVFTSNGYYSLQIYRAERLKFSSGDKFDGTPAEYKDASLSMSTSFGRYTVDPVNHTIIFKRDRSSVPNLDDTTGVDAYQLNGDELSWKVAARKDGSIPITVLRRVRDPK